MALATLREQALGPPALAALTIHRQPLASVAWGRANPWNPSTCLGSIAKAATGQAWRGTAAGSRGLARRLRQGRLRADALAIPRARQP